MIRLVLPTPQHQEAPTGYLWRMARVNGFSEVNGMLKSRGFKLNVNSSLLYREHLPSLLEALDPNAYSNTIRSYFHDQLSSRKERHGERRWGVLELRSSSPRFCVSCLKEFGYIHESFENQLMTVCPIHQEKLITSCPQCGAINQWHRLLGSKCPVCLSDYEPLRVENKQLPRYQIKFMKYDEDWVSLFTQKLLQAARPLDAVHEPIIRLNLHPDQINELLGLALAQMSSHGEMQYRSRRWDMFNSYSSLNLSAISAEQQAVTRVHVGDYDLNRYSEFVPKWLNSRYGPEYSSELVDVETALGLLGLDMSNKLNSKRHAWLKRLSTDINDSLAFLGVLPVYDTRKITQSRFHIGQLDAAVNEIKLADYIEFRDPVWVYEGDEKLVQCGVSIFDLIFAAQYGWLKAGRIRSSGFLPLKLEREEYHDWLHHMLTVKCSKPVPMRKACDMYGISLKQARKLARDGVWGYTKGDEVHTTYVSGELLLKHQEQRLSYLNEAL